MTNLVIILGLAFSTAYTAPVHETNSNNNKTIAPAIKLKVATYYVVNRKTGVPARNAAEAAEIAAVSTPYGNIAYLNSSACRSWWLSQPVVPGGSVTWSYYYYSVGATITSNNNFLFILACPL